MGHTSPTSVKEFLYSGFCKRKSNLHNSVFFLFVDAKKKQRCVTTRKLQLWLLIMDQECARLALLGMTLPAQSSLPLLDVPNTPELWWAWVTKTATSVTRLSQREVSSP